MLITLADLKTFLGITDNTQDALLNLLNNMASAFVETKTNRTFDEATYTDEEYDGSGNRELKLNNHPITSFSRLQRNDASDNTDNWTTIDATTYWVEEATGIITKTSSFLDFDNDDKSEGLSPDYVFSLGKFRYRATYNAGYATIPYDIQMVAAMLISFVLNKRKAVGLKSETLGDHTITFEQKLAEDSSLANVINNYRDIPIC